MQHLISVVVPIYNVEIYLNECIESIINQSYHNLEIILVNDGSCDHCGKICDEYSKIDGRIKVIHKENGGLSSARNAGLDIATGTFVCFIDSDDWIDPQYINILYTNVIKNNCDIAVCGFVYEYDHKTIDHNFVGDIKVLDSYDAVRSLYHKNYLNMTVAWNKLYQKELFNNIRYKVGIINEDEDIIHQILYHCSKIVCIHKCLYHYRIRANSISTAIFSLKNLDSVKIYEDRLKFFKENDESEFIDLTLSMYFRILLDNYCKVYYSTIDDKSVYLKMLKSKIDNYLSEFLTLKNMRLPSRVLLILYKIHPVLGVAANKALNLMRSWV